jgi:hypothetical protein
MFTVEELDRATSCNTPTAAVQPPRALLRKLRHACIRERWRMRALSLARVYLAVGATAGIVALLLKIWN